MHIPKIVNIEKGEEQFNNLNKIFECRQED